MMRERLMFIRLPLKIYIVLYLIYSLINEFGFKHSYIMTRILVILLLTTTIFHIIFRNSLMIIWKAISKKVKNAWEGRPTLLSVALSSMRYITAFIFVGVNIGAVVNTGTVNIHPVIRTIYMVSVGCISYFFIRTISKKVSTNDIEKEKELRESDLEKRLEHYGQKDYIKKCNICNHYVDRYDHHCFVLSKDIGRANHYDFLMMNLFATIWAIISCYIFYNTLTKRQCISPECDESIRCKTLIYMGNRPNIALFQYQLHIFGLILTAILSVAIGLLFAVHILNVGKGRTLFQRRMGHNPGQFQWRNLLKAYEDGKKAQHDSNIVYYIYLIILSVFFIGFFYLNQYYVNNRICYLHTIPPSFLDEYINNL